MHTFFVGMIGDDSNGELVRRTLAEHDVDTTALLTIRTIPTGTAQIMVDEEGENAIVVVSGANSELTPAELEAPGVMSALDDGLATVGLAQGADLADALRWGTAAGAAAVAAPGAVASYAALTGLNPGALPVGLPS